MTRRSRAQQRELTCQRILDAATEVFAEHGYAGASIDAITARAGYSRGAFYSNFTDKTELLIRLTQRRIDAFAEQELPDALSLPPEERVQLVARWLSAQEPPIESLLAVELARLRDDDPDVAATLDRVFEAIFDSVDRLVGIQGSGLAELPRAERRERVVAIVAGVTGANLLRQLGVAVDARTLELVLTGVLDPDGEVVA